MVGTCLAALLAREEALDDWRIALVDPATARRPDDAHLDLRVSALSRASERILDAAGAWHAITPHAMPYDAMVVWDAASGPGRRPMRCASPRRRPPSPTSATSSRTCACSGPCTTRRGCATSRRCAAGLAGLELGEDAAHVTLDDGRRLSTQLVVGADGEQSAARQFAGIGDRAATTGSRPSSRTCARAAAPVDRVATIPANGSARVAAAARRTRVARVEHEPARGGNPARGRCSRSSASESTAASDAVLGDLTLASERAAFPLALWHARESRGHASCWWAMPRTRSTRSPARA